MTEALGQEAAAPSYDAADLRQRMAVCFTASELRALADAVGAEGVQSDRGVADVARAVVRHFERHGDLAALVAILRSEKPLVEWPDPLPPPDAVASPFGPAPDLAPPAIASRLENAAPSNEEGAAFEGDVLTPRKPSAQLRDAAFVGAPDDLDGPIIQDPHVPLAQPWISGGDGVVRPGASSSRAPPPARGIDPKILIAVAALTLLAAVFAFVAGRATSRTTSPDAARASLPAAGASASPTAHGPAAMVAAAFSRSLGNVARVCEVPPEDPPSSALLRAAFDRCGPRPIRVPSSASLAPPSSEPTAAPDPGADRSRLTSPGAHDALPPGPTDSACFKACQRDHLACKSKCGPEPTDASRYGDYQSCQGRCLAGASKCRLACSQ